MTAQCDTKHLRDGAGTACLLSMQKFTELRHIKSNRGKLRTSVWTIGAVACYRNVRYNGHQAAFEHGSREVWVQFQVPWSAGAFALIWPITDGMPFTKL